MRRVFASTPDRPMPMAAAKLERPRDTLTASSPRRDTIRAPSLLPRGRRRPRPRSGVAAPAREHACSICLALLEELKDLLLAFEDLQLLDVHLVQRCQGLMVGLCSRVLRRRDHVCPTMMMGSNTNCKKFADTQLTRTVGDPCWMAEGSATRAMTAKT